MEETRDIFGKTRDIFGKTRDIFEEMWLYSDEMSQLFGWEIDFLRRNGFSDSNMIVV